MNAPWSEERIQAVAQMRATGMGWPKIAKAMGCCLTTVRRQWASEQRIHPVALAKHGYEKARRIGMMAMVGGKDKTKIRNATPEPFRDMLLSLAKSAAPALEQAASPIPVNPNSSQPHRSRTCSS